jgi:cap2 methyltransferase
MENCNCGGSGLKQSSTPFVRELTVGCGQIEYDAKFQTPNNHFGQLKLLLSEIEFLTPYYGQEFLVIYAGAAPGLHTLILARMFPTMKFVLVDPAPSIFEKIVLKEHDKKDEYPENSKEIIKEYEKITREKIEVRKVFMTPDIAREFSGREDTLFISDVRVGLQAGVRESGKQHQQRIHTDMVAQQEWVRVMRPRASILKFRLPWWDGNTRYLKGDIFLPVYGRPLTHETRLIVKHEDGFSSFSYDNQRYEQQMAFFNQKMRHVYYEEKRCYDCTAFYKIINLYCARSLNPGFDPRIPLNKCHEIESELQVLRALWELFVP